MIIAINERHQSNINKAIKYLAKYNDLNDQRNIASDNGEERLHKKLDRTCADVFDKYLCIVYELPKRERRLIEKSDLY